MTESETNTSLGTFARCPREYELRYAHRLELDRDEEREALAVGTVWHLAHELVDKGHPDEDAYLAIAEHAPSDLWREKLQRLFAAHRWYWSGQEVQVVEAESEFAVELEGFTLRGKRDGIVEIDGRRGILERKTSGEDIGPEAAYWNRLRLDRQTGLYFLAARAEGWAPEFILYDVVRKPTIRPKTPGTKKDREVWKRSLEAGKPTAYFGELVPQDDMLEALRAEQENTRMYGARLTAEIGNDPARYFQRRPVHRTREDFEALVGDLVNQLRTMDAIPDYWRNPSSCDTFGRCDFAPLCWRGERWQGEGQPPEGFRVRPDLHSELGN